MYDSNDISSGYSAMCSIIFLKRKQYAHHWLGVVCIVLGVSAVGAVAMAKDNDDSSNGSTGLGIILIIIA